MQGHVVAVALLAACGSEVSPSTQQPLELERWSPPQHTSYDLFLGARGDVVVLQTRVSRDGGATWRALDPRLGAPTRIAITGTTIVTHTAQLGLARWDLATDTISPVSGVPGFAGDRTWRTDPITGELVVFDKVENAIAIERGGSWSTSALPQPTATEIRPYVQDLESNGQMLLATSAWGVHRSADGTAWQLVTASLPGAGRDLLVLADGRFVLVGGATTYLFDHLGQAAGTLPGFGVTDDEAMACEDGTIVARGKLTSDLGASWQPLIPPSDLDLDVTRSGCGGGRYWVLASSASWGYRLVRFDVPGMEGSVIGNWEASGDSSWVAGGPPIVRDHDGTFLVAGLAWAETDAAWTLRETPSRTWASGGTLFGIAAPEFFTSHDGGSTWSAAAGAGIDADDPEAFARAPDGSLHVSRFTGETVGDTGTWRSVVWRSTDQGASWSIAYDASATRVGDEEITGEVHRFVGIRDDDAWIATDAVSRDRGATWQRSEATGDRSLAFLTLGGSLVTTLPADSPEDDIWRVYGDGGLGELRATYRIEVDGTPVPASQLRSIAFDDDGYVYVARGEPYVQIWRSVKPVDGP